MNLSSYQQNEFFDGKFRGGALAPGGAVNSTAVVTGVWTASTAYSLGNVVVPHANMTGGGGKFLQCTTAGTSGSTNTLAVPAVGSNLSEGSVVWTSVSGLPSLISLYVGLLVINKGLRANSTAYSVGDCISLTATGGGATGNTNQHLYKCTTAGTTAASQPTYQGDAGEAITDGTAVFTELSPTIQAAAAYPAGLAEVSGGSYLRVAVAATLAAWSGTQSVGSTTASTGTNSGTGALQSSNNATITFASPTAAWATAPAAIGALVIYDQTAAVGGNLRYFIPLTTPKTVNSGDASPSFAAAALAIVLDS